jgi:hypothetical protein
MAVAKIDDIAGRERLLAVADAELTDQPRLLSRDLVGGHGHVGNVPGGRVLLQRLGHGEAVQIREPDLHEDQAWLAFGGELERLDGGVGLQNGEVGETEGVRQDLGNFRAVLDDLDRGFRDGRILLKGERPQRRGDKASDAILGIHGSARGF